VLGACSSSRSVGGAAGPVSGVRLVSGRLASAAMRRSVGWTLSVPDDGLAGVVYCLHGKGDDHRFAFDTMRLPAVAMGGGLAIAAVDGGADSYWHRRADGTDAQAMLFDEFLPLVEARLGARAGGAHVPRALLGWSMGGYGALLAAETRPSLFAAVAVASPALWVSPGATAPGAFDSSDDYRRHDVFSGVGRLAGLRVRVDCGRSDPFAGAVQRFVKLLPPGWVGSFGPGHHGAAYWRGVAPAQSRTLADALRAAGR